MDSLKLIECVLTSLLACLFLDGFVLVYPARHTLLVRVLEAEVVRLQDVEMGKNVSEEFVVEGGALKHESCQSVPAEIVKREKFCQ